MIKKYVKRKIKMIEKNAWKIEMVAKGFWVLQNSKKEEEKNDDAHGSNVMAQAMFDVSWSSCKTVAHFLSLSFSAYYFQIVQLENYDKTIILYALHSLFHVHKIDALRVCFLHHIVGTLSSSTWCEQTTTTTTK